MQRLTLFGNQSTMSENVVVTRVHAPKGIVEGELRQRILDAWESNDDEFEDDDLTAEDHPIQDFFYDGVLYTIDFSKDRTEEEKAIDAQK